MPLPTPAPSCTRTVWPACTRARTPAGTRLTRYSWSLISFGTPTCIPEPRSAAAGRPRGGSVVVDLGLLQLAGVVHVHGLPLGEDVDRRVRRAHGDRHLLRVED